MDTRRGLLRVLLSVPLVAGLATRLEEASGQQLGWFFDQWVYRPGHPMLRTAWEWDAAAGEAVVTVEQTQQDGGPTVRLPIENAAIHPRAGQPPRGGDADPADLLSPAQGVARRRSTLGPAADAVRDQLAALRDRCTAHLPAVEP